MDVMRVECAKEPNTMSLCYSNLLYTQELYAIYRKYRFMKIYLYLFPKCLTINKTNAVHSTSNNNFNYKICQICVIPVLHSNRTCGDSSAHCDSSLRS